MKQQLFLYDFDGTITSRDTLLAFIRYACGGPRMLGGFLLYAPLLVLMKLHLYDNGKAKQRLFAHFFKGMTLERFNETCRCFARDCSGLLRPKAMDDIEWCMDCGAKVMVVSASIDNWVAPFFARWKKEMSGDDPQLRIVGTQLEVDNGIVTGRFLTHNCFGPEKVRRVEALLELPRDQYTIMACGDSRGDKEMLAFADTSIYKPYRCDDDNFKTILNR
jgi:HAD superfamily phosphoserine phosphatase-like hydrolase